MATTTSNPTRRVVQILRCLSASPVGLTLSEIADELGIAKATCSSILAELVATQVVERSPDKRYAFGHVAVALSEGLATAPPVVDVAHEIVPHLVQRTRMVVLLNRVSPEGIELLDGWWPGDGVHRVGSIVFPFSAPFGSAAVAWMSQSSVASWIAAGGAQGAEVAELRRLLATMRRDRFVGWTANHELVGLALESPERLQEWFGGFPNRGSEPSVPTELLDAVDLRGIPGTTFKSSRRLDVCVIVAPVFGPHGMPTHQLELFPLADDLGRARRLHLAGLVSDAARMISEQAGASIP